MERILILLLIVFNTSHAYYTSSNIKETYLGHGGKKPKVAKEMLLRLVKSKDSDAMKVLYDKSSELEMNKNIQWLKLSAEFNNKDAILNLIYELEEIDNKDRNKWLIKYKQIDPYYIDSTKFHFLYRKVFNSLEQFTEAGIKNSNKYIDDYFKYSLYNMKSFLDTFPGPLLFPNVKNITAYIHTLSLLEKRKYLKKLYLEKNYFIPEFVNLLVSTDINSTNNSKNYKRKNLKVYSLDDLKNLSSNKQDELIKGLKELKVNIKIKYKISQVYGLNNIENDIFNKMDIIDIRKEGTDFGIVEAIKVRYKKEISELRLTLTDSEIVDLMVKYYSAYINKEQSIMKNNPKIKTILSLHAENELLLSFYDYDIDSNIMNNIKDYNAYAMLYSELYPVNNTAENFESILQKYYDNENSKGIRKIIEYYFAYYFHFISNDKQIQIVNRNISKRIPLIFHHLTNDRGMNYYDISSERDFIFWEKVYKYAKVELEKDDIYKHNMNEIISIFTRSYYTKLREKIFPYIEKGANFGNFEAQKILANYYNEKNNKEKAIFWYEKAANNPDGDKENYPAYWMGWEYLHGNVLLKDYPLALDYFTKSSFLDAKCEIARMYALGKGVKKDLSKAKEIIQFTKDLGNKKYPKKKLPKLCTKVYDIYDLASVSIKKELPLNDKIVFNELKNKYLNKKKIVIVEDDIPELLEVTKVKKANPKNWLFVIATEEYDSTDNVKYSLNSAYKFIQTAQKTLGISERNTYSLTGSKSTSGAIKDHMAMLISNVKKGDKIYFYYSGHGIPVLPDNEPYILPKDKLPDMINKDKYFKLKNIYKMLSDSKASQVVAMIDSCFSGSTDGKSLIKGVAASRLVPKKVTFNKSKMVVLTAGKDKQYSNMYEKRGHRLFSYFLMKSMLKGKTDIQDIYREVYTKVKDESFNMGDLKIQEPTIDGNINLKL